MSYHPIVSVNLSPTIQTLERELMGVRGGGRAPPPQFFVIKESRAICASKVGQFRSGMLRSNGLNYKNGLRSTSTDKTIIVETCFIFRQTNFESNL